MNHSAPTPRERATKAFHAALMQMTPDPNQGRAVFIEAATDAIIQAVFDERMACAATAWSTMRNVVEHWKEPAEPEAIMVLADLVESAIQKRKTVGEGTLP